MHNRLVSFGRAVDSSQFGGVDPLRLLAILLLTVYLTFILVLTLVLFPNNHPSPNLIPLRSILHDWRAGGRELLANFAGNLVAFVPFGVLILIGRRREGTSASHASPSARRSRQYSPPWVGGSLTSMTSCSMRGGLAGHILLRVLRRGFAGGP